MHIWRVFGGGGAVGRAVVDVEETTTTRYTATNCTRRADDEDATPARLCRTTDDGNGTAGNII